LGFALMLAMVQDSGEMRTVTRTSQRSAAQRGVVEGANMRPCRYCVRNTYVRLRMMRDNASTSRRQLM
jgi:hypothetical protein